MGFLKNQVRSYSKLGENKKRLTSLSDILQNPKRDYIHRLEFLMPLRISDRRRHTALARMSDSSVNSSIVSLNV